MSVRDYQKIKQKIIPYANVGALVVENSNWYMSYKEIQVR